MASALAVWVPRIFAIPPAEMAASETAGRIVGRLGTTGPAVHDPEPILRCIDTAPTRSTGRG